jgi:flagella basal body P-ring formation protein FlgA
MRSPVARFGGAVAVASLVVLTTGRGSGSTQSDVVPAAPAGTGTGTAPPTEMLESVLVATGDIPVGSAGDEAIAQGLITVRSVPAKWVPPSTVMTPDDVRGRVARFPIAPGTLIVDGMFVDPAQRSPTAAGPGTTGSG